MRLPIASLSVFRILIVLLAPLSSAFSVADTKNGFVLDDASVPPEEILHGGPARDGIRSLEYPAFVAADDAGFLKSKDRVLGIERNGVARAYPVRILNYHEIVNDAFGGSAIAVTYCPLCNSGIAFDSKVGNQRLEFGVSGLLYNSDVLLYDRQTGSLWSQIEKAAITGEMKGTRLESFPMAHTTWRDWVKRHPDTQVLSDQTGFRLDYKSDPYLDYRGDGRLLFPVAAEDSRYRRKSFVLGLEIDGQFKAYPFPELNKSPQVFVDEFQGRKLEVRYDKKNKTASIYDENGNEVPSLIAYWFAWYAFHPGTEVYEAS